MKENLRYQRSNLFALAQRLAICVSLWVLASHNHAGDMTMRTAEADAVVGAAAPASPRTAVDQSIRPFQKVQVPQAALDDLRRRIKATRWPEKETTQDDSQGVPLAMMQELARYWAAGYDWRK